MPGEPTAGVMRSALQMSTIGTSQQRTSAKNIARILECSIKHARDLYFGRVAYTDSEVESLQRALNLSDEELQSQRDRWERCYAPERAERRARERAESIGNELAAIVWNGDDLEFLDWAVSYILDSAPAITSDTDEPLRHWHVKVALAALAHQLRITYPERQKWAND